ncbi:MAG: protein kinase domain-containing protein [Planctomycetota bacterium]
MGDENETIDTGEDQPSAGGTHSGKILGGYEILEEIGRGGMGVVYKAFNPDLKRNVALKVLIAGEDASEEAIGRFHREAEAVAKLGHHPNIVPVYDIGTKGNLHYFAMHLVSGKPLDERIDEGAIPPRQAASIAKKLAEALHHAHQHGILHRDVKPSNVIMAVLEGESGRGGDGGNMSPPPPLPPSPPRADLAALEPMLTDFGLAKDVESESEMTLSGTTLGTPSYMPPEQAEGRLSDIDERADVYSLGATLYEILALRPPFEGAGVAEVIKNVLLDEPIPPRRLNRLVEKDLETICLKCLEKSPERRYPTARDLALDLGRFLEGASILARPPSLFEKGLRKVRRHKGIAVTVLLASLLLAAVAVVATVQITRGKRETAVADAGKKDAEDRLDKNKKVAHVLLGSYAKLTKILAALKQAHYDDRLSVEKKKAVFRSHEADIFRFCDAVPADPPSQATMLAVRGWLMHFGGFPEEALALFARARKTDGDVAWGFLLEAMVRLAWYLERQPLAARTIELEEIIFGEMPVESRELREARETFEGLIAETPSGAVGVEQADRFREALEGLRGIQEEDLDKAERGLTRAFDQWSLAWMEEEIHLARAKVRYMRLELDGALEDLRRFRGRCPGNAAASYYLGVVLLAKGLEARAVGKDPTEFHRRSLDAFSEAIRNQPGNYWARNERGNVHSHLGKALAERGADPRPEFRSAVEDFNAALSAGHQVDSILCNRANARRELAKAEARFGIDPRPLLAESISDFEEVLRKSPDFHHAYDGLGRTYNSLGEAQEERGVDPEASFTKAIEQFGKVLRRRPGHAQVLCNRGNARFRLGQWEAAAGRDAEPTFLLALADFDKALEAKPDFTLVHANRGNVWIDLGEFRAARGKDPREAYEKAIEECDRALEADPGSADAYNCRGQAFLKTGEVEIARRGDPREAFGKAVADFTRILERNPAHVEALVNRGSVYNQLGQWEWAHRLDPRGSFRKAIDDYTATLGLNPELAVAYSNRAAARLSLGMTESAQGSDPEALYRASIKDATEAIQRNPSSTEAYNNRGNAHRQLGDFLAGRGKDPGPEYSSALEDYEEALKRSPGNTIIHFNRGKFILFLADRERAAGRAEGELLEKGLKDFLAVRQGNPEFEPVYSYLAGVHRRMGEAERRDGRDGTPQFLKSLAVYREALRRNPSNFSAQANLGVVQENLGRWQEAVEAYRKALALRGGVDLLDRKLCILLVGLGEPEAARKHADRLVRSARSSGQGHYAKAVIETVQGNADKAFASFTEAYRSGVYRPYCLFHILRIEKETVGRKKLFDTEFAKLTEKEKASVPAIGCKLLAGATDPKAAEASRKSGGFDHALLSYYLGVYHGIAGNGELAKAAFERAAGVKFMTYEKALAEAALKTLREGRR